MRFVLLFSLIILFSVTLNAQENSKVNTVKHGNDFPVFNLKNNLVFEDFESGVWPPTGWTVLADTTPQTWDTASFDPHSGSYYAHCLYDETLSGVQNEYLISPVMDMRGVSSAVLTFYFQFSQYWGITPNDNYDLYVFASTDSGMTFPDTVWHELDTDTSSWASFEWVLAQVDLAAYIGDSTVALAFVYYGYDGAEASIDDILVQTAGAIDETEKHISVYPNPAKDFLNIESEMGFQSIEISDINGKILFSEVGEYKNKVVNLEGISTGVYFLTLSSKDFVYSKKILIRK